MEEYKWIPLRGKFEQRKDKIIFKPVMIQTEQGSFPLLATMLCNQRFSGGTITAQVQFTEISQYSSFDIIIYYDPENNVSINAGIGSGGLFSVRLVDNKFKSKFHATVGDRENLQAKKPYQLIVKLKGSRVILNVDGITVISTNLPYSLPQSQVGISCWDDKEIAISDYKVERESPKVFVVMQFTTPYNELYADVIKRICDEFDLETVRADETYGPGLILADILSSIIESKFIIAEITPQNPNVYYELGYAHALNKATILIAEKPSNLPFDVSPFRILLYENSIRGKKSIEEGLRRHIEAILKEWQ